MSDSPCSVSVIIDDPTPPLPRCPLCKKADWSRPIKVLDCGHSFCQSCLRSAYSRKRERVVWWNELANCRCIKCPQCKGKTAMPWIHLERLRTNFDLQHFLDAYYAGQPPPTEISDQSEDVMSEGSELSSVAVLSPVAMTILIRHLDDASHVDTLPDLTDWDSSSSEISRIGADRSLIWTPTSDESQISREQSSTTAQEGHPHRAVSNRQRAAYQQRPVRRAGSNG